MRCTDLIRELSVPTDTLDSAALADHLAQCAQCAAWAERNARLNRVWEATRPPELSDQAWDRIWAKVSEGHKAASSPVLVEAASSPVLVEAGSTPVSRSLGSRRWMSVFVAAQAAAILIAALVLVAHRQKPSRPVGSEMVADLARTPKVEIGQEQLLVISLDARRHVRDITPNDDPNRVTPDYAVLNYLESIAE